MNYTNPDVYRVKAIVTTQRHAARNKAGRELMTALNAYNKAHAEARKSGGQMPQLSDYVTGRGAQAVAK